MYEGHFIRVGCVGGQLQGGCVRGGHKGKEARPGTWKLDLGAGNGAELRQLPPGECRDVWRGQHHCRTALPRSRSLEWCLGPAQVTLILSVLWRPVPGGPEGDQDQGQSLGWQEMWSPPVTQPTQGLSPGGAGGEAPGPCL